MFDNKTFLNYFNTVSKYKRIKYSQYYPIAVLLDKKNILTKNHTKQIMKIIKENPNISLFEIPDTDYIIFNKTEYNKIVKEIVQLQIDDILDKLKNCFNQENTININHFLNLRLLKNTITNNLVISDYLKDFDKATSNNNDYTYYIYKKD